MNRFWKWFDGITLFLLVVNALTTAQMMLWLFNRGTILNISNNRLGEGIWETSFAWLVALMGIMLAFRWGWWLVSKNPYSQNKVGQEGNE